MRSPSDMGIIEIDITNACPHTCSNCTRFCGHHKKPFFMDFETFKNAVDSLKDFPKKVGMMGGEPTLHPEFEKFVEYLRESRLGKNIVIPVIREPVPYMAGFIAKNLYNSSDRMVLLSSLNKSYYKNFETINDSFNNQLLNDHDNTCLHQALLMPRKELGISDEEWIKKRDACWIQNTWSAGITPKGAFFCEVAGSLDMLFDGPGGWKVEPGWWKRTPEEFGDQLNWCEMCSGCLDVPKRISNDERDDMTPQVYEKLKAMGSPKIAKSKFFIHDPKTFDKSLYHTFTGGNDYMEAGGNVRTSTKNREYYPKNFAYVKPDDVYNIIGNKEINDWVIVAENPADAEIALRYFSDVVINPGCVYLTNNSAVFNVRAKSLRKLFNSQPPPEKFLQYENIWNYYPPDKIVKVDLSEAFYEKMLMNCLQGVPHGSRLVIFGADGWGRKLYARLINENLWRLCGWVDTRNFGYPVMPPDINLLSAVEFIIVAFPQKEICLQVEAALKNSGIDSKKILKFHL